MQRLVQAMGFWLVTSLTTAGLTCTAELDSVIAIAGETLEDQVSCQDTVTSVAPLNVLCATSAQADGPCRRDAARDRAPACRVTGMLSRRPVSRPNRQLFHRLFGPLNSESVSRQYSPLLQAAAKLRR